MRSHRRGFARFLACAVAAVLALSLPSPDAGAALGGDRFYAGEVYRGEFGAPSVLVLGKTYYAYATTLDGLNLPVMTSTDLTTWRARPAYPLSAGYSTWSGYNDALPHPATFAVYKYSGGKLRTSVWAPSVAKIGSKYVAAYVIPVPSSTGRRCISIATSTSPIGAFRDTSTKPIVCSSQPGGSIDPQIFRPGNGYSYLLWKNSGVKGSVPTRIWVRRLAASGTSLAPGTRAHLLLQTAQPWEGNVIEAPAMAHYHHRFYLFYSGNHFIDSSYATGYAICSGPLGPCHRPSTHPLLATGWGVAGPGAASTFVDLQGRLRLAYSAWDQGHVGYPSDTSCLQTAYGCNQRKLHIATLTVGSTGRLHLADRGA
jgi:beta-xylosidase